MKKVMVVLVLGMAFGSFAEARGRVGVEVNYPGLGIKYVVNKTTIELKTQFGEDVFVIGPRVYHNFSSTGKTAIYVGGEVDYITFEGKFSKGSGYVLGGFAGVECPVSQNVKLSMDFGPAYISLKDKETKEKESGLDWVINFGLTYYFGGGEKK